ncbi:hypothetical protein [Sporosarcina psychrophila]|uniref:BppU N-terminal domain-containing protein n=1 Tax=Sporosarcina psychrophila TaxID=1476 RepID=A0ABV2KBC4_SPOPS
MSIISGFFDSVNKDRVYNAEFLATFHSALVGNGIYPNPSNNLQVVERTLMTTTVKVGKAWINGHFIINNEDFVIQHDMADGALSRIDRVVLQLDTAGRMIDIVVKKGAFSSNPVAPVILRNVDFYELILADVRISAGQIRIIQSNITDQRLNKTLCGIVHGYIDQVDTTTIFNQYQSWFNDYSVTKASEFLTWQNQVTTALENWVDAQQLDYDAWRKAEEKLFQSWSQGRKNGFDAWFETVKDVLDTTADGKLLNQLNDHKDASMPHVFLDATDNKIYKYGFKTNSTKDGLIFVFEEEL